jgi:putative transposase
VMKAHGLLLCCSNVITAKAKTGRHDGRVAIDCSNTRWCSDGFELGCDNGERVRALVIGRQAAL